jgi:hypothetical protein
LGWGADVPNRETQKIAAISALPQRRKGQFEGVEWLQAHVVVTRYGLNDAVRRSVELEHFDQLSSIPRALRVRA